MFTHRSERDRLRGANILRRGGYRLPGFLLGRPSRPTVRPTVGYADPPKMGSPRFTSRTGRRRSVALSLDPRASSSSDAMSRKDCS
jgi:hypothetical protein